MASPLNGRVSLQLTEYHLLYTLREYYKIQNDENRDKYLECLGFKVLRFENRFVFQDPEYLKGEIRKFFNKNTSNLKE